MNRLGFSLLCKLAAATLALLTGWAVSGQVVSCASDLAACCDYLLSSTEACRRQAEVRAWHESKRQVVRELCQGRLTLFAAAGQFLALNREKPRSWELVAPTLPGNSDEERVCHELIRWSYTHLMESAPGEAVAKPAAFRAELYAHLDCFGSVALAE